MFFLTIHDAVLHILLKKDIASSPKLKLTKVTLRFPSFTTVLPYITHRYPSMPCIASCELSSMSLFKKLRIKTQLVSNKFGE